MEYLLFELLLVWACNMVFFLFQLGDMENLVKNFL
jgi:hypothetical protein